MPRRMRWRLRSTLLSGLILFSQPVWADGGFVAFCKSILQAVKTKASTPSNSSTIHEALALRSPTASTIAIEHEMVTAEVPVCFQGGACVAEAVAHITGEPIQDVMARMAPQIETQRNPVPSFTSIQNYLLNDRTANWHLPESVTETPLIERMLARALSNPSKDVAIVLLFPGHVESIFEGRVTGTQPLDRNNKTLLMRDQQRRLREILRREGALDASGHLIPGKIQLRVFRARGPDLTGIEGEKQIRLLQNYEALSYMREAYDSARLSIPPTAPELQQLALDAAAIHGLNFNLQKSAKVLRDFFDAPQGSSAKPRVFTSEVMKFVGENMGTGSTTMPHTVRLASNRLSSLKRIFTEGVMPNPDKVTPNTLQGGMYQLVADGGPLVSTTDHVNEGLIRLLAGFTDPRRAPKEPIIEGYLYEAEDVPDAVAVPEILAKFKGKDFQHEFMVPRIGVDRLKKIRRYRIEVTSEGATMRVSEPVTLESFSIDPTSANFEASLKSLQEAINAKAWVEGAASKSNPFGTWVIRR